MRANKMTKALVRRLAQSRGDPVSGLAFAAIETKQLPLSSFAARAAARDQQVKAKLSQLMACIQRWEASSGQTAIVAVRPAAAAIAVTAPPELFAALAQEEVVAALDVDAGQTG